MKKTLVISANRMAWHFDWVLETLRNIYSSPENRDELESQWKGAKDVSMEFLIGYKECFELDKKEKKS